MALNVELRSDDGFECRNRKCDENGSKHRYREMITMTLNVETKMRRGWL